MGFLDIFSNYPVHNPNMKFATKLSLLFFFLCLGVFVLPFYFPLHNKTISASYDYHFNNFIAAISLILTLGLSILFFYKQFGSPVKIKSLLNKITDEKANRLSIKHLFISILIFSIVTLTLYSLNANYGYGEEAYFLYRIDRLRLHQIPYRDFEYAYGILFIYLPYFINQLFGVESSIPGYYISQLLFNSVALCILFFCINNFGLSLRRKKILFYFLVCCFIPYQNGLNCSLFRYVIPILLIFLLLKYRTGMLPFHWRKATGLAVLSALIVVFYFGISLEIAIALLIAEIAFLGYAWIYEKKYEYLLSLTILIILLLGFYFFVLESDFLQTLKSFKSGAMNWIVIPSPSICLYVIDFLFVNFILAAKVLNREEPVWIFPLVFNLVILAAAFGRCDPTHILDNGLSVFMLAFILLSQFPSKFFRFHNVAFFLVFVVAMNISSLLTYKESIGMVLIKKFSGNSAMADVVRKTAGLLDKTKAGKMEGFMQKQQSRPDTAVMARYSKIALPFYVDPEIYLYLLHHGNYAPEFYTDLLNVGTESQLQHKLNDLMNDQHEYMIIPEKYLSLNRLYSRTNKEERKFITTLFFFPFMYNKVNDSRKLQEPIYRYIINNYDTVGVIKKGYVLVKRHYL
jgi:hypothetical protein